MSAVRPIEESEAFMFVSMLATEVSVGKVDLPSFPDIALRVRKALQDDDVSADTVARIVGAEPGLAARMLQLANSAAMHASARPITDLKVAIARLGFDLIRSTSIAFAMAQLAKAPALRTVREPLRHLWQRSALVAALASVVARRHTKVNPGVAALAGILHGIGKLYVRVRSVEYPKLFADPDTYAHVEKAWHTNIAKALLENWQISPDVVAAVHLHEDLEYTHEAEPDLTDILIVANLLVVFRDSPERVSRDCEAVPAVRRMLLDAAGCEQLLAESAAEIEALRSALGS